jgi:hypothetical protein
VEPERGGEGKGKATETCTNYESSSFLSSASEPSWVEVEGEVLLPFYGVVRIESHTAENPFSTSTFIGETISRMATEILRSIYHRTESRSVGIVEPQFAKCSKANTFRKASLESLEI